MSGEDEDPIGERDEIADPEASPSLPAATLARTATPSISPAAAGSREGYREIWTLAWPFMLAQMLASLVSLIDIAMVGRLGTDTVAAVGYATQFFFLAQSVLLAVGFACVALMARAIGSGDPQSARSALAASILVSVGTALFFSAVILAAPRSILELLGADTAIIDIAIPYLTLVLGSSVLLAIALVLENAMRANRDTVTPMRIAIVVALVKTALNAVLIFGTLGFPRLELLGAGYATVAAQAVGLVLFIAVARRAPIASPLALTRADFSAARRALGSVIRLALPGVAERLAMNFALLAYFRVLGEYGPTAIAAYTVGIRILSFSWMPGTGFGAAAATLVGQALGAGEPDRATRVGWRATRMALVVAVTLGILCAFARNPLAHLFTNDPAIVAELGPFLLCLAIAQPFLQTHFALGGAHRGAGDTFTPLIAATLGNWALRVPLAVFFSFGLGLDVEWVWYALIFDHLMRTVWLGLSFRRGKWRNRLGNTGVSRAL